MKLLFCLLGLVLVMEGIPYFAFPDKMKNLRAMGLLAMCAGLVIAYLFKE
jgi:uncharacterized protein YjeT (DUF2065 family)